MERALCWTCIARTRRADIRCSMHVRCTTRTFRALISPTSCRRSRHMRRFGSVRSGGQHPTLHCERICACHRTAARFGEIRGSVWSRGFGSLRHNRMDHAPALVRRQCRNGWHLRIRWRAVARRCSGPSGFEGNLSLRRLQRLWRDVWFSRFRPRGVLHTFPYLLDVFSTIHESRDRPARASARARGPLARGDAQRGLQAVHQSLQHPDSEGAAHLSDVSLADKSVGSDGTAEQSGEAFKKIKIPFYTGSGAYAYTYKLHWLGAQHYFQNIEQPKKLIFTGPAHLERPFISITTRSSIGTTIGLKVRTPASWTTRSAIGLWVPMRGAPRVTGRSQNRMDEILSVPMGGACNGSAARIEAGAAVREPDVFTQMPLTRTAKVERLRYVTDPLPQDVDVVGPIALTLYAAIDQNDTNWIVVLKDVGPDVSVRTAREGERAVPRNLPERELTRGWLKASYRAVDEKRSKPWEPFHKLTRAAVAPVVPGEIVEYRIQILGTANRFKAGHRICLDITSMDVPTGTGDDQRRIHSLSCVQQPDGDPPNLIGTPKGHPSAVAHHS